MRVDRMATRFHSDALAVVVVVECGCCKLQVVCSCWRRAQLGWCRVVRFPPMEPSDPLKCVCEAHALLHCWSSSASTCTTTRPHPQIPSSTLHPTRLPEINPKVRIIALAMSPCHRVGSYDLSSRDLDKDMVPSPLSSAHAGPKTIICQA